MQTKQEAELIYHRAGESPWASYTTQPCFTNRLWQGLSQIPEPKVLNATLVDNISSTDVWAYLQGLSTQGGGQVFEGAQVSLPDTNIQVPISKTAGPPRLLVWCFWLCHPRSHALGVGTGLQTLLSTWGGNTYPWPQRASPCSNTLTSESTVLELNIGITKPNSVRRREVKWRDKAGPAS